MKRKNQPHWLKRILQATSLGGRPKSPWRRGVPLGVETLENRAVPAVYTVTGTADAAFAPAQITATGAGTFDAATLRSAIIDSNANLGDDTILLAAAEYELTFDGPDDDDATAGDLDITDNLIIQGAGSASTIIDGNQIDRVFHILPDVNTSVDVTISDVTIRNGLAPTSDGDADGGGIYNDRSTLLLQRSVVRDNQAIGDNDVAVTAFGGRAGAGIFNRNGALTILDSEIRDNTAQGGRGDSNSFSYGGGFGGAARGAGLSTVIEGLSLNPSTVLVQNSTLAGNQAVGGVGARPEGNAFGGDAEGGGIHNVDSFLTVINSTLSANTVTGGDAIAGPNTLQFVVGGEARGGGIFDSRSAGEVITQTARVTNTTITLNQAIGGNGDFGGNAQGGGFNTNNDSEWAPPGADVGSTIIAGNTVTSANFALGPDVADNGNTVNSLDFNLIGNGDGSTGFTGANDQVGSTGSEIDPQLLPLALNQLPGHPAPLTRTHALDISAGSISPAIDNGTTYDPPPQPVPATDQRGSGYFRTVPGGAETNTDVGAYEVQNSSLSGFVYRDWNDNGVFEPGIGETGIEGVTVDLTGTDFLGNAVSVPSQVTDANGFYVFEDLRPSSGAEGGGYTITETQPAPFGDGLDTQGTPGNGTTGDDVFSGIVLAEGVSGVNNNFGEIPPPSSLAGFVYEDDNDNGVFEPGLGETGIAGVPVALTGTDVIGDPVSLSTFTDGTGAYLFANLRASSGGEGGGYTITETQPAGFNDGQDTQGTPGTGITNNDQFANITLDEGVNGENNNFGELTPTTTVVVISKRLFLASTTEASAGDPSGHVYLDVNQDGVRQFDEPPVANAVLELEGLTDGGQTVHRLMLSNSTGFYAFQDVAAGIYALLVTAPTGFAPFHATAGNLGGNAGTDRVTDIDIPPDAVGVGYDFGVVSIASSSSSSEETTDSTSSTDSGESLAGGILGTGL